MADRKAPLTRIKQLVQDKKAANQSNNGKSSKGK